MKRTAAHTRIATRLLVISLIALTGSIPRQCKKFEVTRKVILATGQVSQVTQTECQVTGTFLDLKDEAFPSHGFHWATSLDAIRPGDTVNLGLINRTKEVSIRIARFQPGTRYFIWTYVNDGSGEIRAEATEFTTLPAQIPAVETGEVTVTGSTMAQCVYNVSWNGESPLINRGLCWGEGDLPTVDGPHTEEGTGTGEYTGSMTGLTPSTDYHVRAYAVNAVGIAYGDAHAFSTPAQGNIPVVKTDPAGEIGSTTAFLGGSISDDGGLAITEKGVALGTDPDPGIEDYKWIMGTGSDPFSDVVAELSPDTRYYYRAYAINAAGVGYGEGSGFTTRPADLADERNGKVYRTVRISEQVWMAENLDMGTKINGGEVASDNTTIEKYCYGNDPSNCEQYGALYTWDEMMQYNYFESTQGVCPDGWHIPSDGEWKILESSLGMNENEQQATDWRGTDEGGKLKAPGTDLWNDPNLGATNESGFSALPAGGMDNAGNFDGLGTFTFYWSSSLQEPTPWYRYLDATHSEILRLVGNPGFAASVRCIRD